MTARNDLDRQLNDLLRDGPTELPYQSFDAVRDRTEQTGQRVVIGPWRLPEMNKLVTIGLGAAAVVVAVFVGAQLFGSPSGGLGSQVTPTPEPTAATPEPSPSVAAEPSERAHFLWEGPDTGVSITVTIAASGWSGAPGQGFIEWGPEGASGPTGAGMIAFSDPEYFVYGDACHWEDTRPDTAATTVDELVDAMRMQVHRVVYASRPEDITVDGYAGKKIILGMGRDGGLYWGDACDEGTFALFGVPGEDPARYSQGLGQLEEVWVVDVDGQIVVLDGVYYEDTSQNAVDELRAILASATFELP